jgi:hypothetical protein
MGRYITAGLVSGILFGLMDGLINANPWARRLFEVYKPIAKSSINAPAGIAIDLAYGFIMAGVFLLLYASLPGATGLLKGISFGLLVWFFRVVMSVASSWMMFNVPGSTLLYQLITGLGEMMVLGVLYGLIFLPSA